MIKKFVIGKSAVFIDASNIYFSQRELQWRVDFERLLRYLDFEALIKYLKKRGKRCLVFSIKNHVSIELLKQAKFIDIKKLEKYLKK